MKILKIFGAVVGLHLVAFILIFANPGCTSTKQPSSPPPVEATGPSPSITVSTAGRSDTGPSLSSAPAADPSVSFDPNAPAISSPRYNPTRPGTPAAGAVQTQPVADVTPATTYTVVNGDSLTTIAKKNHTTIKEISAANHLGDKSKLKLGQKLIIPGRSPALTAAPKMEAAHNAEPAMAPPTADVPAKAAAGSVTHTVKAGESLGAIARKYQVKSGDIAVANNITNPALIKPGMTLIIPGWTAPKGSGKASSAPAAYTATQPTPTPVIPAAGQDLDAGLKPSTSAEIPVIRIDDAAPAPAKKSP